MSFSKQRELAFPGFPDGVNNTHRPEAMSKSALQSGVNIDLLPDGKPRRRGGYLRRLPLTDARSGASHHGYVYLADQGNLLQVDPVDYSTETIANVHPTNPLSFAVLNEYLYITDGHRTAIRVSPSEVVTSWSPEHPNGQPHAMAMAMGGLPAGDYQVAVTFLRGEEESGTDRAVTVAVPQNGSIQLSAIPVPASNETTGKRVYVTTANGQILYAFGELPPETTAATITSLPEGKQLETQFLEPLPVGGIVREHGGRLMSAVGDTLYYSQALRYGLCRITQDYYRFDSQIDMVRPVEGGIFVSAGRRIHFLSGADPSQMTVALAHHAAAVPGTDIEVPAGMFSFENLSTGTVAAWWSKSGVMVLGFPNGQVQPVREGELSLPEYAAGAMMFREQDGARQLVSVLRQPTTPSSGLAARDEATVTVHRNGIEI